MDEATGLRLIAAIAERDAMRDEVERLRSEVDEWEHAIPKPPPFDGVPKPSMPIDLAVKARTLEEAAAERAHDAWARQKRAMRFHAPSECEYRGIGDKLTVEFPTHEHWCSACHADLVSYADLPEATKELDRATVRSVAPVYEEEIDRLKEEREADAMVLKEREMEMGYLRRDLEVLRRVLRGEDEAAQTAAVAAWACWRADGHTVGLPIALILRAAGRAVGEVGSDNPSDV